jgi:hypothetical protein
MECQNSATARINGTQTYVGLARRAIHIFSNRKSSQHVGSGSKARITALQQQRPLHLNQQTLREDNVEEASQKAALDLAAGLRGNGSEQGRRRSRV